MPENQLWILAAQLNIGPVLRFKGKLSLDMPGPPVVYTNYSSHRHQNLITGALYRYKRFQLPPIKIRTAM